MKYGRTKAGDKWHSLTAEGEPVCVAYPSTDRPMSPMRIVEQREASPGDGEWCCNCSWAMRRKGRRLGAKERARAKAAARSSRDTYEPRNGFKESQ